MMRMIAGLALFLAIGTNSACSGPSFAQYQAPSRSFVYKIKPGDSLRIETWTNPEDKPEIVTRTVHPDGHIQLRFVGDMPLTGLTPEQAARVILDSLKKFIQVPQVTVTVVSSLSNSVYVLGEVPRPGRVPFNDGLSAVEALAEVGGPIQAFSVFDEIQLLRRGPGPAEVYQVDLEAILAAEKPDLPLQPGDVIYVPTRTITRFDRFSRQLLTPIGLLTGTATNAALAVQLNNNNNNGGANNNGVVDGGN